MFSYFFHNVRLFVSLGIGSQAVRDRRVSKDHFSFVRTAHSTRTANTLQNRVQRAVSGEIRVYDDIGERKIGPIYDAAVGKEEGDALPEAEIDHVVGVQCAEEAWAVDADPAGQQLDDPGRIRTVLQQVA